MGVYSLLGYHISTVMGVLYKGTPSSYSSQTLSVREQDKTTTTRRQEDEENERGIIHVMKTIAVMSFITILIVYFIFM